jgi:hypothetical protein
VLDYTLQESAALDISIGYLLIVGQPEVEGAFTSILKAGSDCCCVRVVPDQWECSVSERHHSDLRPIRRLQILIGYQYMRARIPETARLGYDRRGMRQRMTMQILPAS